MLLAFLIINTCNTSRFQDLSITLHISLNYLPIFQFHYLYIFLFLFCCFFCTSVRSLTGSDSHHCQATNRPRTRPPTCGARPGPKSRDRFGTGFIPTLITMVWFCMIPFFHSHIFSYFSGWPPSFLWVKVSKSEVDGLFQKILFSENL